MRLDITEILSDVGKVMPYDIQEPPLVDEYVECTRPVEGRITFNNTGGLLLVTGKANTMLALPCSRCGEYFEQPLAMDVEESFELRHSGVGPRTTQNVQVIEEDESPIAGKLFDGHVFDLTEMLRQYILLDEPTQPLPPTQPDGRCAHCHRRPEEVLPAASEAVATIDPNAPTPINPAFAKLSELLNKEE